MSIINNHPYIILLVISVIVALATHARIEKLIRSCFVAAFISITIAIGLQAIASAGSITMQTLPIMIVYYFGMSFTICGLVGLPFAVRREKEAEKNKHQ